MKTAECEGFEEVGLRLREASAALVLAVEPLEGTHNLKALVETADRQESGGVRSAELPGRHVHGLCSRWA